MHFRELIENSYFLINLKLIRGGYTFSEVIKKTGMSSDEEDLTNRKVERLSPLGIILVPDKYVPAYVELNNQSPIKRIMSKIRRR